MTNKEAYQLIESCLDYDKDMSENPEAYVEAIGIAKEVFDKQEQMKPVRLDGFRCRNCSGKLARQTDLANQKNCHHCGQKLDWED